MGAVEDLLFRMRADTRDAVAGFDKVGKSANRNLSGVDRQVGKTQAAFGAMGKYVAGAAVAGAVVNFAKKAITAASDLAESQSKTKAIFKESSAEILKWSKTSATSLGQSQRQALDAASAFAGYGKSAGLAGAELVKFSTRLTGLATDLASFHNTSVQDAIDAVRSGLSGEMEPLKRYNVLLSDAALRQSALRQGIISTTKQALTPQQKVLAASAELFKQTADAQGDFARTSGGLAGQQKILGAKLNDLLAELGGGLLPAAVKVTGALVDMTDAMGPLLIAVTDVAGALFGWAADLLNGITGQGKAPGWARGLGAVVTLGTSEGARYSNKTSWDDFVNFNPFDRSNFLWNAPGNLRSGPSLRDMASTNNPYQQGRWRSDMARGVLAQQMREDRSRAGRGAWAAPSSGVAGGMESLADAARDVQTQIQGATAAVNAHKRAQDELAQKTNEATDALLRQWSSALQLEAAQDALEDSIAAYSKALKTKDVEATDDALRDLKSSVLSVAEAAGQAAVDGLGPMASEADQAKARTDAMKQAMLEAAAGVAPGSPAYYQIQTWIALLGKIPASAMTKIGATYVGSGQQVIGARDKNGRPLAFDDGGVVPGRRGAPMMALVHGGETILPTHKQSVSTGGNTFNITIHAADGRAVVEEIRRYERVAGTAWRN